MNINIKETTDAVFALCERLYSKVSDEVTANPDLLSVPDPYKVSETEHSASETVAGKLRPFIEQELRTALPQASFWWKPQSRPASKLMWVVSPFEFRLMDCTYSSIALMQDDELLLGAYLNYKDALISTGEKDEGAFSFEEEHRIENARLHTKAGYMYHYAKEKSNLPDVNAYMRYRSFLEKEGLSTMNNNVIANLAKGMIGVAKGEMQFVIGQDFHFCDIAAALCIVEQAGGIVTDLSGSKEGLVNGSGLFCGNKKILEQFMDFER